MNKNDNSNHPFNEIQSTQRKPSQVSPAVKALHNNFQVSIRDLKRDLVRSIYYLRVIYDRKIFRLLGYDNIREYAAEAGGLNEGQCKAFLKIGEKLGDLPTMKRSLEEGSISWHKASQIVDLAEPENETELIEAAKSLSTSKLKELVRPRITSKQRPQPKIQPEPLILPTAKPPNHETVKPADSPCYVTYKFSPEQYSLWAAFNARSGKLSKEEKLLEALKAQTSGNSIQSTRIPGF